MKFLLFFSYGKLFAEEEDEDEEEEEEDDKEKEGVEGEAPPAGTTVVDGRTEQRAKHDEQAGLIDFVVVENDDSQEAMIVLTGAKNIFQKQLPKMPKEYITRLVYDRYVCGFLLLLFIRVFS